MLQDGRRPFLSVDALATDGRAPTALSRRAVVAREAAPRPAVVGAPRFSGDYALSRTGNAPSRYALFRIGATAGVTLTIPEVLDGQRLALYAGGWGVDRAGLGDPDGQLTRPSWAGRIARGRFATGPILY